MCLEKGKGGVFGDVNLRSRAKLCSIKQKKNNVNLIQGSRIIHVFVLWVTAFFWRVLILSSKCDENFGTSHTNSAAQHRKLLAVINIKG